MSVLTLTDRLALYAAYDAQEPDAQAGMRAAYRLTDNVLVKAALVVRIERGDLDYDGLLAAMRRAAVGMPVPDDAGIAELRQTIRGVG